jgi:hypothetical protein
MRCRDARRLISERLDGPVSATDEQLLDGHAAICAECRVYLHKIQSLERVFAAPPFAGPPAGFADRVMAQVRARQVEVQHQHAAIAIAPSTWTARPALAPLNTWIGWSIIFSWAWLTVALVTGVVVFSALDGWDWLAGAWSPFGRVQDGADLLGNGITVGVTATWNAIDSMLGSFGMPIMLSSTALAIALCFVWYRLLRRYQLQVG